MDFQNFDWMHVLVVKVMVFFTFSSSFLHTWYIGWCLLVSAKRIHFAGLVLDCFIISFLPLLAPESGIRSFIAEPLREVAGAINVKKRFEIRAGRLFSKHASAKYGGACTYSSMRVRPTRWHRWQWMATDCNGWYLIYRNPQLSGKI